MKRKCLKVDLLKRELSLLASYQKSQCVFICWLTLDGRRSQHFHKDELQQDVGAVVSSRPAAVSCLGPVKMCITANFLSVSVLIFVCVTDGTADSGELDLSGIDDSEIELVRTCSYTWNTDVWEFLKITAEKKQEMRRKMFGAFIALPLPLCSICWVTKKSKSRRRCGWQKTLTTSKSREVLWECSRVSVLKAECNFYFLMFVPEFTFTFIRQTELNVQLNPAELSLGPVVISHCVVLMLLSLSCTFRLFFVSAFREGSKGSKGEGARDLQRKEGNRIQQQAARQRQTESWTERVRWTQNICWSERKTPAVTRTISRLVRKKLTKRQNTDSRDDVTKVCSSLNDLISAQHQA